MGEAGVRSGHVVQPPQPRACPPAPREEGFGEVGAGLGGGGRREAQSVGRLPAAGAVRET